MGAQWAPVVTQGYFLINVHTKWLEEIAHQLSVNVKYIHTHAPITRISQHTRTYIHMYISQICTTNIYIQHWSRRSKRKNTILRRNMREVEVDVLSGVDVGVASPLVVAVVVAMWKTKTKKKVLLLL